MVCDTCHDGEDLNCDCYKDLKRDRNECFCNACYRGDTDQCEVPSWAVRMTDQGWACYPPGSFVPSLIKAAVRFAGDPWSSAAARSLENASRAVAKEINNGTK